MLILPLFTLFFISSSLSVVSVPVCDFLVSFVFSFPFSFLMIQLVFVSLLLDFFSCYESFLHVSLSWRQQTHRIGWCADARRGRNRRWLNAYLGCTGARGCLRTWTLRSLTVLLVYGSSKDRLLSSWSVWMLIVFLVVSFSSLSLGYLSFSSFLQLAIAQAVSVLVWSVSCVGCLRKIISEKCVSILATWADANPNQGLVTRYVAYFSSSFFIEFADLYDIVSCLGPVLFKLRWFCPHWLLPCLDLVGWHWEQERDQMKRILFFSNNSMMKSRNRWRWWLSNKIGGKPMARLFISQSDYKKLHVQGEEKEESKQHTARLKKRKVEAATTKSRCVVFGAWLIEG